MTRLKPEQYNSLCYKFSYVNGHPSGYTDDLGIIAPDNIYIAGVSSGYVALIKPNDYNDIKKWCNENNIDVVSLTINHIKLSNTEDVAWFLLRFA